MSVARFERDLRREGEGFMVVSLGPFEVDSSSRHGAPCRERSPATGACCARPSGHSGYHAATAAVRHVDGSTVRYGHRWLDAEQEALARAASG